jgi:hypothetical protein
VTEPPAAEGAAIPNATQTSAPVAPPLTEVPNASPELARLYNQLPDDQNPYKLLEKAARAQTFEMKKGYTDQANALTERYTRDGIPLPSGTVNFPGVAEAAGEKARIAKIYEGEGTSITNFNSQMSEMQSGFGSRSMTVDGLREILKTAETGKFGEIQADLYNVAASIGLANAKQIQQAADFQTAMKLFASGILESGMKDKIGPQISNADLMLISRTQGGGENLPAANRNIIGAMYGKLMYDRAKVAAWDDFVKAEGGIDKISTTEQRDWERKFGKENNILDFVEQGKANTPVAGEVDPGKTLQSYYKKGWKYVDPKTGRTFVYQGKNDDGQPIYRFLKNG